MLQLENETGLLEMLMLWTEGAGILLFDAGNQYFFLGGRPPLNSFRIAAIFRK